MGCVCKKTDEAAEEDGTTNTTIYDVSLECGACPFTLGPHEKHKSVLLKIQPSRAGIFHVCGCFMKALNVTTSLEISVCEPALLRELAAAKMRLAMIWPKQGNA